LLRGKEGVNEGESALATNSGLVPQKGPDQDGKKPVKKKGITKIAKKGEKDRLTTKGSIENGRVGRGNGIEGWKKKWFDSFLF